MVDPEGEPVEAPQPDLKVVHPADYVDAPEPDPWTELVPLFTVQAWDNRERCGHKGPIPNGSSFVCMGCHKSGKDGSRALPWVVPEPPDPPVVEEPEPQAQESRSA